MLDEQTSIVFHKPCLYHVEDHGHVVWHVTAWDCVLGCYIDKHQFDEWDEALHYANMMAWLSLSGEVV